MKLRNRCLKYKIGSKTNKLIVITKLKMLWENKKRFKISQTRWQNCYCNLLTDATQQTLYVSGCQTNLKNLSGKMNNVMELVNVPEIFSMKLSTNDNKWKYA